MQHTTATPSASTTGRWFSSASFDLGFFHLPVWIGWLIVLVLAPKALLDAKVPIWAWVVFVLLIDVAHVWATIFRTYWDPEARKRNKDLLIGIPLGCFLVGFALAFVSDDLFWTVLAYIAVFHFVKQQYGITALYHGRMFKNLGQLPEASRDDAKKMLIRLREWDKIAIYVATLFPVIYWHIHLPKKIWWFSKWDFLPFLMLIQDLQLTATGAMVYDAFAAVAIVLWVGSIVFWLGYHIYASRLHGFHFPIGKVLWVLGTYFNWWLGIVYLDSPFAFTLTNVIAHGIPYFGLVYLYQENAWKAKKSTWSGFQLSRRAIAIFAFAVPLLCLAFFEEYLWDLLVRGGEYKQFFTLFVSYPLPKATSHFWLAFWLALLSLPQATHYFLDRYLWRPGVRNPHLKEYLHL